MLRIEEIGQENMGTYAAFMGEDLSEDMQRAFYRGYGVVDEERAPQGIMVYELLNAEQTDGYIMGRILMLKANSREAYALIHSKYSEEAVDDEEICESFYWLEDESSADSCEKAGFSKELKEDEYVSLTLKEASENPMLSRIRKLPGYIRSLKDISSSQYRLAIRNCLFKGVKGELEDLGYLKQEWFDNDISACTITDNEVSGLFLIRTTASGIVEPVLLHADGPDSERNLAMMTVYSIRQAMETRKPESVIRVRRSKQATVTLVDRLFPGLKGKKLFFGVRKEY